MHERKAVDIGRIAGGQPDHIFAGPGKPDQGGALPLWPRHLILVPCFSDMVKLTLRKNKLCRKGMFALFLWTPP
jgi:hypothetical protein